MDVQLIIQIVQIISGVILVTLILLQKSEAGVGGAFGGGSEEVGVSKRRGAERVMFFLSITFLLIFLGSVIVGLIY